MVALCVRVSDESITSSLRGIPNCGTRIPSAPFPYSGAGGRGREQKMKDPRSNMSKLQIASAWTRAGQILAGAMLVLLAFTSLFAQSNKEAEEAESAKKETASAPVTLDGSTVFEIKAANGSVTIEERAGNVSSRLKKLADDSAVDVNEVRVEETEATSDIVSGDTIILSVGEADAKADDKPRKSIAEDRMVRIKNAVAAYREKYGLRRALIGGGLSLVTIAVFLLLLSLVRRNFPKVTERAQEIVGTFIASRKWRILALIDVAQVKQFIGLVLNLLKFALLLTLTFITLQLVLGFLPWTENIAAGLLDLLLGPLQTLGAALVREIPNLIFIAVVVVIAHYLLKVLKAFFRAVQRRQITFRAFAPEWAMFTYRLSKIGVVILALIISFPYIPGSDSEAFRGISIFLGLLVSFGSTSIVANTVGGITLNYLRTFNVGDRVKIGDYTGDIIRSSLQVTHLRTIKNEEIMVPNSMVVANQVVNYSTYAKEKGLILHTKVTIGYDTPWRQVHALLLKAAEDTEGLLKEPKPFILQTSLDDFYASYELNVYTNNARSMARLYSDLHENIQDAFNEFGVQIMSPNYIADRSEPTVVPKEKWFEAPATEVSADPVPDAEEE